MLDDSFPHAMAKNLINNDPQLKNMMIQASDLKPGTSAMDDLVSKFKNRLVSWGNEIGNTATRIAQEPGAGKMENGAMGTGKPIMPGYEWIPSVVAALAGGVPGSASIKGVKPGVMGEINASEAFANRAAQPLSTETKIAQIYGRTGEVRDAMPKLIEGAKKEYDAAQWEKQRAQRQASQDAEWEARKRLINEGSKSERAKSIVDEINANEEANRQYELNDGAEDYHYYMWEDKRRLKDLHNIGPETQDLIDWAKEAGVSEDKILDALKRHSSIETGTIYNNSTSNPGEHLDAMPIGEKEVYHEGLKEKLDQLSPAEMEYVNRETGARKGRDYTYVPMDYDVHYLMPDLEATKNELSKGPLGVPNGEK